VSESASSATDAVALTRRQFGANAEAYATSPVHVRGASLGRLVEVLPLQSTWRVLDIATGSGSVALAVAPSVAEVVATDITPEMLDVAGRRFDEAGPGNISAEPADAHHLPYDDASFDLVTCRIAPHHFSDPDRFVAEGCRVLRPGGFFGLVDNVVPDGAKVADFANNWERKRDPSHIRCLSVNEWLEVFTKHGLEVEHRELISKEMGFTWWCDNMDVAPETRLELLAQLREADPEVTNYLRPGFGEPGDQSAVVFHLTEVILVGQKPDVSGEKLNPQSRVA